MPSHVWAVRGVVSLPYTRVNGEKFRYLCGMYPDMSLELAADGTLLTKPPVGVMASCFNFKIMGRLAAWMEEGNSGVGFGNGTGFTLPDGAILAPCLSWVRSERWEALSREQQEDFAPLCPDFVVEHLTSEYDLKMLRAKMREYRDNGTRLGWLFNLPRQRIEIYRPGRRTETVRTAAILSGQDVLPGLTIDLAELWP